ncbi:multidrug transporter [Penicillium canescens]|nr:multidrug transporter [Penicillium canescens]KAJ6159093.1 multidrug transporter [Penicillium canescens]
MSIILRAEICQDENDSLITTYQQRVLPYFEELLGFELPATFNAVLNLPENGQEAATTTATTNERRRSLNGARRDSAIGLPGTFEPGEDLDQQDLRYHNPEDMYLSRTKSRLETAPFSEERLEIEADLALQRTQTKPIIPRKSSDGSILMDWYTTDDAANHPNWSNGKRFVVSFIICLYTFVVYTGSAIYTSSEEGVMGKFNVGPTAASLSLALYVLAYGIEPLLWAPLSEVPVIGRSPVYAVTMALFTILSLPTALVDNFAGLLVLRFLQGFFGRPCLANGAATMQDTYCLGLGSLLWTNHWAPTPWICGHRQGITLVIMGDPVGSWTYLHRDVHVTPETSTPNILLRRALRLRQLTGNKRLLAQSEIDQKNLRPSAILMNAIAKPMEITIKDPAIAFVDLYTALVYSIYYSFFEGFPLVYPVYYGFSLGMIGVVFTCVLVACLIGVTIYCLYLTYIVIPDIMAHGLRAQESRLVPALYACFGPTIGLFLFG